MTTRRRRSCHRCVLAWTAVTVMIGAADAARAAADEAIPEQFQAASAVVLNDETHVSSSESQAQTQHHVRLKILTRKGFSYANQVIWYEGGTQDLMDFSARTIRQNGTSVEVPLDLRHDVIAWKTDALEFHALYFTFPAVEEGVVLEWRYAVASSGLRALHRWDVQRSIPVLEAG